MTDIFKTLGEALDPNIPKKVTDDDNEWMNAPMGPLESAKSSYNKLLKEYTALQSQCTEKDEEIVRLKEWISQVDKSLYAGEDLNDKEILYFYIGVWKLIKEDAKRLLAEIKERE